MIKRLRRRIVILLTTVVAIFGLFILCSINYISYHNLKETCMFQIDRSILFQEEQDSNIQMNMITCVRNQTGYMVYSNSTDLNLDKVEALLDDISNLDTRVGNIGTYYFLNLGNQVRIMDFNDLYQSFYRSLITSISIFIVTILGFIYIARRIARRIVTPVEDAFNRQKKFISDVSHELKTPLAIIQTNTEILQMDEDNKQLGYIAYETGRMNTLITKLLQLTRIESNPNYSELKSGNLSKVVLKAAMPFESLTFEKGFKFTTNIQEDITIPFNDMLVEQLITILLDNALKHTKENGEINISLAKNHHKVILSVKDEGDEISKEDQKKIFERFYRVDQARNRKDNRYGLGLSIAQSIMEAHNGSIEVQSDNGITEFICKF